ncbi:FKBP-type peptidyl-prolyl cis-trans isomerase domain [Trinorchestia longiramus]|nr:FKBP-type peptidyl-prolyl cis-trans isomerase domain [Trinorchestia longiramus]
MAEVVPEVNGSNAGDAGFVDITPKQDGGVLKKVLQEGCGEDHPAKGNKVFVHYVGTLESDGSKFDSSRDRDEQFSFNLGKQEVIKAWDIGMATMKKGEKCILKCRSDYAYGESGSPPKIPGGATLMFEVELFRWQGEDLTEGSDGGILRYNVTEGEGVASPNENAFVKVKIVGEYNGKVFDDRTVDFTLSEGCDIDIPEGIEKALQKFIKNETSKLELSPKYAFGKVGNDKFNIPPNASLQYTVTLLDFEKAKETWEMSQEEKIDQAKIHKAKGTEYFKAEKYKLAAKQYSRVTDLMSYDSGLSEEKKMENNALKLAGELNLAAVYLKLKDFVSAAKHATNALDQDPENVKALFRRGQALLELEEFEDAAVDFKECLSLDASNTAAKKSLALAQNKIKQHRAKERQIYGGMFEKFVKADAQKAVQARRAGVLKDGVGEWDDKSPDEAKGDLSDVKLISSDSQIKGDEFMKSS